MARSKTWGFPRWGDYGREQEPVKLRLCDYEGCNELGEYPAPKSPNSPERWYFCQRHIAEYNRNWDFFRGMDKEQAEAYKREEARGSADFQANSWSWMGSEDSDGFSSVETKAYAALDLEPTATIAEVKSQFRRLVKQYHPDTNPNDKEAAQRFHEVRQAYDLIIERNAPPNPR